MATELIAIAAGDFRSDPFTLDDDEQATLFLKGPDSPRVPHGSRVFLEIKDDNAEDDVWWQIDEMNPSHPATVLQAKGTFSLRRADNGVSVGACRA